MGEGIRGLWRELGGGIGERAGKVGLGRWEVGVEVKVLILLIRERCNYGLVDGECVLFLRIGEMECAWST